MPDVPSVPIGTKQGDFVMTKHGWTDNAKEIEEALAEAKRLAENPRPAVTPLADDDDDDKPQRGRFGVRR